jgi:hypothetical protein
VGGGRSWQSLKNRWKVHLHDAASELVAHGRTAPRAYPDGHEYNFVVRDGAVTVVLVGDENTPPDDHCGDKHKKKGAEAQDAAAEDVDVRVADERSPPDDLSGDGDGDRDMDLDMACTQYPADVVNQLAHVAKEISRAAGCSIGAAHAALHATSMGMCDPIPGMHVPDVHCSPESTIACL